MKPLTCIYCKKELAHGDLHTTGMTAIGIDGMPQRFDFIMHKDCVRKFVKELNVLGIEAQDNNEGTT